MWQIKSIIFGQEKKYLVPLVENLFIGKDICSKNIRFFSVLGIVIGNIKKLLTSLFSQELIIQNGRAIKLDILLFTSGLEKIKARLWFVLFATQSKLSNGPTRAINIKESCQIGFHFAKNVTLNMTMNTGGKQQNYLIFNI
jgi:hypothetical protein